MGSSPYQNERESCLENFVGDYDFMIDEQSLPYGLESFYDALCDCVVRAYSFYLHNFLYPCLKPCTALDTVHWQWTLIDYNSIWYGLYVALLKF